MTSKSAFEISSDQKVHLVSAANKIGKFCWPGSAIIRSMNDSSIENINFSDQRVCDFVKIPHRSDYNNRSKKSSNEAEPEKRRIIKSSAPLENVLKHEE